MSNDTDTRETVMHRLREHSAARKGIMTLVVGMLLLSGVGPMIQFGGISLNTSPVGQASAAENGTLIDGFESGSLGPEWYVNSGGDNFQVTDNRSYSGDFSLEHLSSSGTDNIGVNITDRAYSNFSAWFFEPTLAGDSPALQIRGDSVGPYVSVSSDGSVRYLAPDASYVDTGIDVRGGSWYNLRVRDVDYGAGTFGITARNESEVIGTYDGAEFYKSPTSINAIEIIGRDSNYFVDDMLAGKESLTADTTPDLSGQVTDQSGAPVSNATVTVRNASNVSEVITNTTTNSTGQWDVTVGNGTYNLSAEKPNYTTDYTNVTVAGADVSGVSLTIDEYDISLDVREFLQPGQTVPYEVTVLGENVSANSTVNSSDTGVVTVDMANLTVSAVDDRTLNTTVTVTANYTTAENITLNASKNITVAALTVENMEILPSNSWRFAALFNRAPGDDAPLDADPKRFNFLFFLLLGTLMAVPMARFTSAFGGLAMAELVLVIGWFAGYVSFGMAAVSVFVALFIGLNLAANIDYQAGSISR